jgi:SpoVK/Ycf46/Vps4 family AAA+-type ATPase
MSKVAWRIGAERSKTLENARLVSKMGNIIIFIDEIDSLVGVRTEEVGETMRINS